MLYLDIFLKTEGCERGLSYILVNMVDRSSLVIKHITCMF